MKLYNHTKKKTQCKCSPHEEEQLPRERVYPSHALYTGKSI